MTGFSKIIHLTFGLGLVFTLSACGNFNTNPSGSIGRLAGMLGSKGNATTQQTTRNRGAETVAVNRYLWAASLDVMKFLPVEAVDPFTGIIIMGYGNPPGGSRSYRATIFITDPALDARSLNVALLTRSGPAAAETTRAIEDAILSRARQLRIADDAL